MRTKRKRTAIGPSRWAIAAGVLLLTPSFGPAKDLLVTGTAPNQVLVVDPETAKVVKSIKLSGQGMPATVVVDPRDDTKIYVTTNQYQTVCKVDLKEEKELVCISLSKPADKDGVGELVRGGSIEANPKRAELYIYEWPVRTKPGKYEILQARIRVVDSSNLKTIRTFDAPRQGLVLASSPDGDTLYSFHVGDIYAWDTNRGQTVRRIPWVHHNVTGQGLVDGLPYYPNYSENGHVVAFPYGAEDRFNGGIYMTGFAQFDLKTGQLQTFEIGRFSEEHYYLGAAVSPKTGRGYMCWNWLAMVDLKEKKLLKQVMMDATRFFPVVSSDGKKLYVPRGSGSTIAVFDATNLKLLKVIELGSNMAAASVRMIRASE